MSEESPSPLELARNYFQRGFRWQIDEHSEMGWISPPNSDSYYSTEKLEGYKKGGVSSEEGELSEIRDGLDLLGVINSLADFPYSSEGFETFHAVPIDFEVQGV